MLDFMRGRGKGQGGGGRSAQAPGHQADGDGATVSGATDQRVRLEAEGGGHQLGEVAGVARRRPIGAGVTPAVGNQLGVSVKGVRVHREEGNGQGGAVCVAPP